MVPHTQYLTVSITQYHTVHQYVLSTPRYLPVSRYSVRYAAIRRHVVLPGVAANAGLASRRDTAAFCVENAARFAALRACCPNHASVSGLGLFLNVYAIVATVIVVFVVVVFVVVVVVVVVVVLLVV